MPCAECNAAKVSAGTQNASVASVCRPQLLSRQASAHGIFVDCLHSLLSGNARVGGPLQAAGRSSSKNGNAVSCTTAVHTFTFSRYHTAVHSTTSSRTTGTQTARRADGGRCLPEEQQQAPALPRQTRLLHTPPRHTRLLGLETASHDCARAVERRGDWAEPQLQGDGHSVTATSVYAHSENGRQLHRGRREGGRTLPWQALRLARPQEPVRPQMCSAPRTV